jgi:DNA-binding transcriptional MerR regulator
MKIYEIINEAINYTQYQPQLQAIVEQTIVNSLPKTLTISKVNQETSKSFDDYSKKVIKNQKSKFSKSIANNLTKELNKFLKSNDEWKDVTVEFKSLNSLTTNGHCAGTTITINTDTSTDYFAYKILSIVTLNAKHIHTTPELINAPWSLITNITYSTIIKNNTKDYVIPNINNILSDMIGTFTHELVHAKQTINQWNLNKGPNIEYRSYMDNSKDEFNNLIRKLYNTGLSPTEHKRFLQLYKSSPQEIPAFAHSIAVDIINKFNISNLNHHDKIQQSQKMIQSIPFMVNQFLNNNIPNDHKLYKSVYNKYLKLVYTEIKNYINKFQNS